MADSPPDFFSIYGIEDSYYREDEGLLNDSDYLNARDNLYSQFIIDIYHDGGALRIKNTDIAVFFNPTDPAQTYGDLLYALLIRLDREFIEDPELWEFTKRDLRLKLSRIYDEEDKKEEVKRLKYYHAQNTVKAQRGGASFTN